MRETRLLDRVSPALSSGDEDPEVEGGSKPSGHNAHIHSHDHAHIHPHDHSNNSHAHSHDINAYDPHPYDDIDPKTARQNFSKKQKYQPKHDDIDRLFSTLKQCVRDWSDEVRTYPELF